jgi:hypothetical protein
MLRWIALGMLLVVVLPASGCLTSILNDVVDAELNVPPTVYTIYANAQQPIPQGVRVQLSASVDWRGAGGPLRYAWSVGGPGYTQAQDLGTSAAVNWTTPSQAGDYVVTLIATNDYGSNTGQATFTVGE